MSTTASNPDDGTDTEPPRGDGERVETPEPPFIKSGSFGLLGDVVANYRYRRKLKRKAGEGYVLWEVVDDVRTGPKFVKPKYKGAGIPELKHDGQRYLFPREARVADKRTGMWFYRHEKDDAVPINLQSPDEQALDPGVLQRYTELDLNTESPNWLDNLDLDPQTIFTYLIIGVIGFAIVSQLFGVF